MRLMLLVGLMGLTFQLEHMAGLHRHAIGAFSFNLVPVLLGIAWLPPRLELMLGVVNLALLLLELARDSEAPQVSAPLLISRILTVGLCFWIARLRADAERRRQELALKAEDLGDIVDTCLQASALAHEIRQPLSVILLSSQLLQQKLEQMEVPDPSCREHLAQMVACANQLNLTTSAMGAMMRSVKSDHVRLDLAGVGKSGLLRLRPV
ncbi:MAG: histidine kinase dimerization/phospho-acceptor domain-containing protein, partial [Prochlorococcaceae cyanobacterium]